MTAIDVLTRFRRPARVGLRRSGSLGSRRDPDRRHDRTVEQARQISRRAADLETVVVPSTPDDKARFRVASPSSQRPLINVRQDDTGWRFWLAYEEVRKEVIQATLADDFDVDVGFRETTTIASNDLSAPARPSKPCTSRPTRSSPGSAPRRLGRPALASGFSWRRAGAMYLLFRAVEETVRGRCSKARLGRA